MNSKYRWTPYYKQAMKAMKNLDTTSNNKKLIANSIASLLTRNPQINSKDVLNRLSSLESIEYKNWENTENSRYGGLCYTQLNKIEISDNTLKNPAWHDEVIVHEIMHQVAQQGGMGGLSYNPYPNINEVITQINAYHICEDLGIEKVSHQNLRIQDAFGIEGDLKYCSFGSGYGEMNRVGESLLLMDKMGITNFQEANFNHGTLINCQDEDVMYSFVQLEEALKKEHETTSMYELLPAKYASSVAMQNTMALLCSKEADIDFGRYMELARYDAVNSVYYSPVEIGRLENVISRNISNNDIMMWARTHGISNDKIINEIGFEHSEKVNEFAHCCTLLRFSERLYSSQEYENASYNIVKDGSIEYITIKIGEDTIMGVGEIRGNSFYLSKQEHDMETSDYKQFGFCETDLSKDIPSEIKFDDNSMYRYILSEKGSLEYALYASDNKMLVGNSELVAASDINTQYKLDKITELIDDNKGINVCDNIRGSESLLFRKNSDGKTLMEHMLVTKDYEYGLNILANRLRNESFSEFPMSMDIEGISYKQNTNLLSYFYRIDARSLPSILEKCDVDINMDICKNNVISIFCNNGPTVLGGASPDSPGNNLRWFIQNGVDATSPIYDRNGQVDKCFQEYVLIRGSIDDVKELAMRPDFNPNITIVNNQNITVDIDLVRPGTDIAYPKETPVEAIFKHCPEGQRLPKIMTLLEHGYDINAENKNGDNCFTAALKCYSPERLEDRECIKAMLAYYPDRFNETKIDGFTVDSNHLLVKTGDAELLKEVLSDQSFGVNIDDVFNKHTPVSWINQYSDMQLDEIHSIQEGFGQFGEDLDSTVIGVHEIKSERDSDEGLEFD